MPGAYDDSTFVTPANVIGECCWVKSLPCWGGKTRFEVHTNKNLAAWRKCAVCWQVPAI